MSGIIGIVCAPGSLGVPQVLGAPLERSLEKMASSLAHRGPDGRALWISEGGRAGLGHLALHATPQAHAESQPLRLAGRDVALTCDARLDNRDELVPQLAPELQQVLGGAAGTAHGAIGDSALILASYLRWGPGCASHLLGDFAFVVWDGEAGRLLCARDHFGVKPFYFHLGEEGGAERRITFASEIKALFEVPGVPRQVNEERIAAYLMGAFGSHQDTAFQEVRRLPAAHTLLMSERGLEIERYWDVRQVPMLLGLSDAEYESRFRTVLFEAVRCRMRAPAGQSSGQGSGAVGAFLSGGMDSSAVVCVAREVRRQQAEESGGAGGLQGAPLPVFSAIYEGVPECDERPWMQAVLDMGGLSEHWLDGEARSPLSGLEDVLLHTDEPIIGPNLCASWDHYGAASASGVRVLLDGHGGDETIGHGHARLHEMVRDGQWSALWRELRLAERHGFSLGEPAGRVLWRALSHGVRPLRLATRVSRGVARRLPGASPRRAPGMESAGPESAGPDGDELPWELLNPEFAERVGAPEMHREWQASQPRNSQGDRKLCEGLLGIALQVLAFEELDKAAAAAQVEARYPLWDKRLVELCLSMPPEQKRRDGWSRSILRRALDGILPREVQWRASKNDFSEAAILSLRQQEPERLRQIESGQAPRSARYVSSERASHSARRILHDQDEGSPGTALPSLVRAASLEAWLQMQPQEHRGPQEAQGPGSGTSSASALALCSASDTSEDSRWRALAAGAAASEEAEPVPKG